MDPLLIGMILVVIVFVFIIMGVYLGFAMAGAAVIGLWWITGSFEIASRLLVNTCYGQLMEYHFGTIPMFLVMGLLANLSGASEELYDAASVVFRKVRGGVGITTVLANAVFAAITGVSMASVVVFSKIALPQMLRLGYSRRFSFGTVAGSSVLGMLIPPSMLLIFYGILAEEGIGQLFLGGVLPGILLTGIYITGIVLIGIFRPEIVGGKTFEKSTVASLSLIRVVTKPWGVAVLVVMVLGGIYGGFFSPTEAGAVGAGGAFILVIVKRRMQLPALVGVLLETGRTLGGMYFLFIGAAMYSRMLAISGLPGYLSQSLTGLDVSPAVIIILFLFLFIIMGALLDSISIMLLTLPIMVPVLRAMEVDLVWFGILATVALEMGMLTPPFGTVVYLLKASLTVEGSVEDIFMGSFPFVIMMAITLLLLLLFPPISVWLPGIMLEL